MTTVASIISSIRSTSGSNDKLAILTKHKDNEVLKRVFELSYNPFIRFYLKADRVNAPYSTGDFTISEAMDKLVSRLASREVTGNAAVEEATAIANSLFKEYQKVFLNILDKDQRCGVSVSSINKVWPGLIPKMVLSKCADSSKDVKAVEMIQLPALLQLKVDAARCIADRNETTVFLSSGGNEFMGMDTLRSELERLVPSGYVVDGELRQKNMNRKKSNGIANKAIRGTITQAEADNFEFIVWDIIPSEVYWNEKVYSRPYSLRLADLRAFVGDSSARVQVVETHVVETLTEADRILQQYLDAGEEGTILKRMDGPWENKRSRYAVKYKEIKEADFVVTGLFLGTGKNADRLGYIEYETADGVIKASVGSGFSDKERDELWQDRDKLVGKVITVRYNQRVDDSLFLPRFVEVRYDKQEADTEDKI